MKRLIAIWVSILTLIVSSVAFTGCKCEHEWDSGTVKKETSCYETGIISYTCNKCGEIKQEDIATTEHDFILKYSTATCTESGENNYECSVCGEEKTEFASKKLHNYDGGYFCVNCGAIKDDKFQIFRFNTSVFNENSWYSASGVVLGIGSKVSEGSINVSFSFLCYSTYSVRRYFTITIINKTTNAYEGQVVGSATFTSNFPIIDKSLTLGAPYSSSYEYYAYVSVWSI